MTRYLPFDHKSNSLFKEPCNKSIFKEYVLFLQLYSIQKYSLSPVLDWTSIKMPFQNQSISNFKGVVFLYSKQDFITLNPCGLFCSDDSKRPLPKVYEIFISHLFNCNTHAF